MCSLTGSRLPKINLVSFEVDDPAELSVLGLIDLLFDLYALSTQASRLKKSTLRRLRGAFHKDLYQNGSQEAPSTGGGPACN